MEHHITPLPAEYNYIANCQEIKEDDCQRYLVGRREMRPERVEVSG